MPIAKITPLGESGLYHIHVLDMVDPGFGGGRPGGVDPGWGLGHPGGHPDQGLPGGGHISNRPPGSGNPVFPDNSLPDTSPPTLMPGFTLGMGRSAYGKWEYAAIAPGSPPTRPLPGPPEHPGNRPPGQPLPPHVGGGPIMPPPPTIGGGPAPTPPNRPDQGLPPTAQPR